MTNNPTIDGVSRAKIHHLKIHAKPFEDLVSGRKTSEVRNCADREFREGDNVELFLIDETGNPANKSIVRTITHVQRGYGLPDDICVLSYAGIDAPAVERQDTSVNWQAVAAEQMGIIEQRQSTIAQLQARVQELESGRGEPVAYSYKEYVWATGLGSYVWREKLEREAPDLEESDVRDLQPLFAAPPAPVAAWVVVSPDGKEISELQSSREHAMDLAHDMDEELPPHHNGGRHEVCAVCFSSQNQVLPLARDFQCVSSGTFENGWNACLDATAALNGQAK